MKSLFLNLSRIIPDKLYITVIYFKNFKKIINFNKVETLNEKIQWLKLNDRKLDYIIYTDKFKVRKYISSILGEEYLIPLLGVWDAVDEIEYENLPNPFVLKCNHDSKSVFICKDKKNFNFELVKNKLKNKLKQNGYWYGREWPYKGIKPCIIAEKYMVDDSKIELKDYKIMCFNGKADNIMVCYNRNEKNVKFNYYDLSWNKLNYQKNENILDNSKEIKKPKKLNEMIKVAEILSEKLIFSRIITHFLMHIFHVTYDYLHS